MLQYLEAQSGLAAAEREQKRARNARAKNPHSPALVRRYEQSRRERERRQRELKRHPRHSAALALERRDPDRMITHREIARLRGRMERAVQECDEEAERTADAVRQVLRRLGYLDRNGPTRKGRGMREIVAGSGIVLSELYEHGALDGLEPAELAEAVSWFASDSRRRRENTYRLRGHLERTRREAVRTYRRINGIEAHEGIELAQGPSDWFWGVALAWCRGASIESITERIDLGEGDIVGVLNKTVDLLDQLAAMLERYGDADLLPVTEEARRLLIRGLVAMVRSSQSGSKEG